MLLLVPLPPVREAAAPTTSIPSLRLGTRQSKSKSRTSFHVKLTPMNIPVPLPHLLFI
ncbi:MAG: hypothetical protein V7L27_01495 [Nostoc sp.]|uniref:hypothetical protein n=1 Tax=Nostoc sp. TaxID=1180 RepID=UPI002FFA68A5